MITHHPHERAALRAEFGRRFAPQIAATVADAPPLSPSQLAFLRRVIRTRGGAR